MKGAYPCFKATYTHDELVEHFLLTPAERAVVDTCYGAVNRHAVAVLLKAVQYLGYFPSALSQMPAAVRTFLAHQLHLLWDHTPDYPWHSTTHDRHLLLIRQHTGFRFPTGHDKQTLETWLRTSGAPTAPTEEDLCECAYTRCRELGLELVWPKYPNALFSHRLHVYHDSRFNLHLIVLSPILIINARRLGRGVRGMDWKKLLGSITASVDEELRLRNAYLVAENRILRQQITGRVQLTDSDRKALAEIGQQLGKKALAEIATVAKPDTILAWHRTFAGRQCDSSQPPKPVGRPRIEKEIEDLVVRMARENRSWGYDRIVGALTNLGYRVSDQTVGNILKRHNIPPAPERQETVTWQEFIRVHLAVLLATDFFTSEVWSWCELVVSSFLCFLDCSRGQVYAVSLTLHDHRRWILSLLARALDVHARAQRWLRLVRLSGRVRPILFPKEVLGPTVSACASSDGCTARPQDSGQVVLRFAPSTSQIRDGPLRRRHWLSGLLKHDHREAA